jgi:hypothetical protein
MVLRCEESLLLSPFPLSMWGTDSAGRLKRQARCIGDWVRFSVETGGRGRRSAGHDCARGPPSRLVGRTPYWLYLGTSCRTSLCRAIVEHAGGGAVTQQA